VRVHVNIPLLFGYFFCLPRKEISMPSCLWSE
jgi:hypothetical protein